MTHTSAKQYHVLIYSSSKLAPDEYSVYADGQEYQTFTITAGISTAGSVNYYSRG